MLDATDLDPKYSAAWRDHLGYGDIVSFRFPLSEEGDEDAGTPKQRPCLVLDIETLGAERYAVLAYGTTSRRRANIGYEVAVRPRADYLAAGLNEPTRFVGARRLLVPLTHEGFAIHGATGSPVLGHLDGDAFERMNAVRGRIHAEHDIRADRRRTRRRNKVRGRDFTVEQRYPKRRKMGAQA